MLAGVELFACTTMKRSNAHKSYPSWRQREARHLIASLIIGGITAAIVGVIIYFTNHGQRF
jgi:hypothetical protein